MKFSKWMQGPLRAIFMHAKGDMIVMRGSMVQDVLDKKVKPDGFMIPPQEELEKAQRALLKSSAFQRT